MSKPINLQAVREATANLDRLAKEHPELLGKSTPSDWEAILKGRSVSERQKELTDKRRAAGISKVSVWLSDQDREELRKLYPGPRGGIDWAAVVRAAIQRDGI